MTKLLYAPAFSLLLGALALTAGCSRVAPFIGSWKSVAPTDMTTQIAGASKATSLLTFSFIEGPQKSDGTVAVTSSFDVTRYADLRQGDSMVQLELALKGEGSITGTWAYDIDDDDDLLLNLDYNSLQVNIDSGDVSFVGSVPEGIPQAQLDSISGAMSDLCKREMVRALTSDFARYTVIEDVEVSKDRKTMGFEIKSPKQDLRFINVDK